MGTSPVCVAQRTFPNEIYANVGQVEKVDFGLF